MAEPLMIRCPSCQQSLQLPEEMIGRTVGCPACQHRFLASAAGPQGTGAPAFLPPPASSGLPEVTPKMAADLATTRPWVLFLSILGFIMCGFVALVGILAMAFGALASRTPGMACLGGIYIPLSLLYLFPAYFLLKYAGGIRQFLATRSALPMEQAIEAQKSFWKFVGILAIVTICAYVLIAIIAAALAVSR